MQTDNFKVQVYQALKAIPDVQVYNSYPETNDWQYPVIIYEYEQNAPHTLTAEGERMTELRFRVEIHNGRNSTNPLFLQVDRVMTDLGYRRVNSQEIRGADSNYFRTIRYDAVHDNRTHRMYHLR